MDLAESTLNDRTSQSAAWAVDTAWCGDETRDLNNKLTTWGRMLPGRRGRESERVRWGRAAERRFFVLNQEICSGGGRKIVKDKRGNRPHSNDLVENRKNLPTGVLASASKKAEVCFNITARNSANEVTRS